VSTIATRQLVKEIQQLLSIEGGIEEQQVLELGQVYVTVCHAVSGRVARCIELIRQGQRSKARQLARVSPDLKTEIETLDFEESLEWEMTCEMVGLSVAEAIDLRALKDAIEEVYAEGTALDTLLTTYRRMALGQAPIADRVRVLRKIVAADPNEESWKEDLLAFEAANAEDLLARAERANREKDLQALEAILVELSSRQWQEPKPRKIQEAVQKIIVPHRQEFAEDRFAELSEQLHEAHSAMDENTCRSLFEEWQEVTEQTGVLPDEGASDRVAPVRTWLDDLDATREEDAAFESACLALEAAIDEDKDQVELERLAGEVLRFERGMPQLVAARYNSRMEELARRAKRRFVMTVTAIVCAVLIVAAGATALILWRSHVQAVNLWSEQINTAFSSDDLEGAGRLLRLLNDEPARLRNAAKIQGQRGVYEKRMRGEKQRKTDFEAAMATISEAGVETPDRPALKRALELARTFEEKSLVADWRDKVQRYANEQQRLREMELEKEVQKLEGLYGDLLEARKRKDVKSELLEGRSLTLAQQLVTSSGISATQLARSAAIKQAVLKFRKEAGQQAARRRKIIDALMRIVSLADKPETLIKELADFVNTYPAEPCSQDFARAARMASEWKAAVAWNSFVIACGGNIRQTSRDGFALRFRQVEDFLKANPKGASLPLVAEFSSYLVHGKNAWSAKGLNYLARTKELMSNPALLDLQALRTKQGQTYYYEKADLQVQKIGNRTMGYAVTYVINAATFQKKQADLSPEKVVWHSRPAPHCQMSLDMLTEIRKLRAARGLGWETLYLRLAAIVQKQKDIDAILQATLLKEMLSQARDCSPYETQRVQNMINDLDNIDLDVAWMDPLDADASRTRPRAVRVLQDVEKCETLIKAVEQQLKKISDSFKGYKPIGVFVKTIELPLAGQMDRVEAFTIVGDSRGNPRFQKVGKIVKGEFVVDSGATKDCPQGSLLFVRQ